MHNPPEDKTIIHIVMIDGSPVLMVRLCDHVGWRTNSERYQYLRDFHVLT